MAKSNGGDSEGWMIFRSYYNLQEAEIDKGLLEANGIPCVIKNECIASVYPMTNTWASLRLMVPRAMAEAAEKLVSET